MSTGGESLAFELANFLTVPMTVTRHNAAGEAEQVVRPVLPQGAPTSPTVTNIVCRKLDRRLIGLAKSFGLRYTRYADDITFSSDQNVYEKGSSFLTQLDTIITDEGFRQNKKKVRLQRYTERQMVTGLVVNERPNVTPAYLREIFTLLKVWDDSGLVAAQELYDAHRIAKQGAQQDDHDHFEAQGTLKKRGKHRGTVRGFHVENVLAGKIDFLRMVDGGAARHFEGKERTPEGAERQGYESVSARHDKLNAKLKMLIEQELLLEAKAIAGKQANQQMAEGRKQTGEANSEEGAGEESGESPKFASDDHLRQLIKAEKEASR